MIPTINAVAVKTALALCICAALSACSSNSTANNAANGVANNSQPSNIGTNSRSNKASNLASSNSAANTASNSADNSNDSAANVATNLKDEPAPLTMKVDAALTQWCHPNDGEATLKPYDSTTTLSQVWTHEGNDPEKFLDKGVPKLIQSLSLDFAGCHQLDFIEKHRFAPGGDIQTVEALRDRLLDCV